MKITKYEHACLDIVEQGTRILIDPGKFTKVLTDFSNISCVIVTHVHSDHFEPSNLTKIYQQNPNLKIFTVSQVAKEISNLPTTIVKAEDKFTINNLSLEFFGGKHELYEDFENIAVLVNEKLFHPGDSYTLPNKTIKVLATPASAPWLRVKDAGQFIINCKPKIVFPIHNILLSEEGKEIHYRILNNICQENEVSWLPLEVGESLEI